MFATDEKLTILDMELFEDNIIKLLDKAEEYIFKKYPLESGNKQDGTG